MPSLETRIAKREAGAAGRLIAVELYEGKPRRRRLPMSALIPDRGTSWYSYVCFCAHVMGVSCDPRGLIQRVDMNRPGCCAGRGLNTPG